MAQLAAGLGKQVPEAMACLENGFEAATHFYAFPKEHWHRIRSTNGLERLHGEVKRRTRAVDAFPDRASALRLVTAVALQATSIWADRRYLDMSLLKPKEVAVARLREAIEELHRESDLHTTRDLTAPPRGARRCHRRATAGAPHHPRARVPLLQPLTAGA
jgi:hypothetical protein